MLHFHKLKVGMSRQHLRFCTKCNISPLFPVGPAVPQLRAVTAIAVQLNLAVIGTLSLESRLDQRRSIWLRLPVTSPVDQTQT